MGTRFIFIVGVSRSGTSLMRRVLNSSNQIAICNENHFLGHSINAEGVRQKFRRFGDLSDNDNVFKLVDHIYSGEFEKSLRFNRILSWHWRWIIEKVDREDFLQRILNSDRSERALFTIMMQVWADKKGRPILGEKTPAHFRYVPTLMEWFPEGKVIQMLRDPRAIFVSELRRRKQATTTPYRQLKRVGLLFKCYIMLQTTALWAESIYRSRKYRRLYPDNYYLLKFEDLVTDPEKQIRQLCGFLEVDFQDNMLKQQVYSRGFRSGYAGFDGDAADRWKDHIEPWQNTWFLFWFKGHLKRFGYEN